MWPSPVPPDLSTTIHCLSPPWAGVPESQDAPPVVERKTSQTNPPVRLL